MAHCVMVLRSHIQSVILNLFQDPQIIDGILKQVQDDAPNMVSEDHKPNAIYQP